MNDAGVQILRALRGYEWLKSQTIGAARWDAVVEGTAPATRTVVLSDSSAASGGGATAVNTDKEVDYVSRAELQEIIDLARQHGAKLDQRLVDAALS
jgi:hypothetical protein